MNTRKTCKILTLASAAFAMEAAPAAKDNIDITVSDNYRTVFNACVVCP